MTEIHHSIFIGVDIAKEKFDTACLVSGKYKHKVFINKPNGFSEFVSWIQTICQNDKPLICMESTGAYSFPLAEFLYAQGYTVSMVNPAKIHAFAKSQLSRVKTDKADAKLIAQYASLMKPEAWTPPPAPVRALQALLRRAEHLSEMIRMEKNRLETADLIVQDSIKNVITTLEKELKATQQTINTHIDGDSNLQARKELLTTIPGIGDTTSAHLLVALSEHRGFTSAKQVVAFAGLAPAYANPANGEEIRISLKTVMPH